MKSEYPTLKETMEQYSYKRHQISQWWIGQYVPHSKEGSYFIPPQEIRFCGDRRFKKLNL